MNKTLVACLVEQYLQTLKVHTYTPLDIYGAARAAGNHNRVNLLTGQYLGLLKESRTELWAGQG